nr:hypothetical protein [Oscillospiraceae bacterium]
MREFEIRLHSVQDVQDFVALATTRSFPVLVSDDHHRVNGKSFMEMFCLNLASRLEVLSDCSEWEFQQFLNEADRFLSK